MKMRMLFTAFALICAGLVSAQTMFTALPVDKDVRTGKLDNGLTYYIRYNKYPEKQADFYIAQKVGSIQEEEEQRGLAHFLEHMCFNGTTNFPGNSLITYLESIGVKFGENLNAYTAIDETVYNINNVPTTNTASLDSCLLILHDWSNSLLLKDEEIDKERSVIHEEWRMRSSASLRMYERALPLLIPNNRYGNRLPIGLMSVVDNFKPEVLRAYYHKWYRPDLQGIIVVGDIDVDRMEQKIKEIFSPIRMPANPAPREYVQVADNDEPIVVCEKDKEQTMTVVQAMFKHDVFPDSLKNTPYYYYDSYLRNMGIAMINQRFAEMANKPEATFLAIQCSDDDFIVAKTKDAFTVSVVPKEGKLAESMRTAFAEVYRADRYGFTETEFERIRTSILSSLESAYQNKDKRNNSDFTSAYVNTFLYNEPMMSFDDEYVLIKSLVSKITLEEVNKMFSSLVLDTDKNLVVYATCPDKEGVSMPEAGQLLDLIREGRNTDLGAYVDNVKNEPLISQLPQAGSIKKERSSKFGFTEWTLSNGVRVVFRKTDFKENEILMSAYSLGGSGLYGNEEIINLSLFDDLIAASGLGNFTRIELGKALTGKHVRLSPVLSSRSEGFTGSSTPRDLRTLFELVYLSFQKPYRDDESVHTTLAQYREVLKNKDLKPMSAFGDSVSVALYGNNPRLHFLTAGDMDKVSYDRILEIYQERFQDASDFTFVFCGNFDTDSLRLYTEQYLAALPSLSRKEKPQDTKMYKREGVYTNEYSKKMEVAQCQAVRIWHGKLKNTLHNNIAMSVLGQILDIRYIATIREDIGAAYSVSTSGGMNYNSADQSEYALQVFAPLKPEMCDTALMVMTKELETIADGGVNQEDLNKIKEYMLKTADEAERLNGAWLNRINNYLRRGMDSYTDYKKVISSMSTKDLQKLARKILKDNNCITVVILPETEESDN